MNCPKDDCEGRGRVLETDNQGYRIRRRRECGSCGHRWTTMEWRVAKRRPQSFSRRAKVWRRVGPK